MGLRDRPASQRGDGDTLAVPKGPDLSDVEGEDRRRRPEQLITVH